MRALVVHTSTMIAPFGDPPGDSLLLFWRLREALEMSMRRNRITLTDFSAAPRVDDDELVLVLTDRTFASKKAIGDFLQRARESVPARLTLRRTPCVDYMLPVTDLVPLPLAAAEREQAKGRLARVERAAVEQVAYDVFLVHGRDLPMGVAGEKLIQRLREQCRPVLVPKREIVLPIRLPVLGSASAQTMSFPITSTLVADVRHWVHILWLNQLAFGMRWMDLLREHKMWAAWRVLTAFPYSRPRIFGRLARVGRRCRIHPTAHIELSEIGDDVVIGARASVRNSFIGSGAHISDHAVILSSTIGQGGFVTPKTFVVWSAAYPGATIGNYKLQVSLVGRDAHVNPWAGLIDAKFKGSVQVELDGNMHSTERSFLGSCVGHRAALAAKVLIQPGRMVPNDSVVVMRPDEVISRVPKGLPAGTPLVRDRGTLVPLERLREG